VSHYFSQEVAAASKPGTVELTVPGLTATLLTDRAVFSPDRVDVGTRLLLIEGPDPVAEDRVIVDVGAGYGPIACTLARRNPEATVWAVEVNPRARDLCAHNAAALGLANLIVAAPDDVPDGLVVDRIWSNPPVRVGKRALHELLLRWLGCLRRPTGSAHLVVHRNLGADSLAAWLAGEGYRSERRTSRRGYRVLDIHPPETV
jgi:16S rRNA (guanine1207-N2)-methyltransferase